MLAAATVLAVGPMSRHMLLHIAVMNLLAPLVAVHLPPIRWLAGAGALFTIAAVQFGALALLHTPHGMHMAAAGSGAAVLTVLALLAIGFWHCVLRQPPPAHWRSMLALLLTGKLFCMLGVLLLFAPRSMYGHGAGAIADQQMAGLLMLIACPLTYTAAAVWLCIRWLDVIGLADRPARA